MEYNTRRFGTVVTTLNVCIIYLFIYLFFFAALTFMHLESRTLKEVQCPASKSILSDLDTKILIQVLNLLWMD